MPRNWNTTGSSEKVNYGSDSSIDNLFANPASLFIYSKLLGTVTDTVVNIISKRADADGWLFLVRGQVGSTWKLRFIQPFTSANGVWALTNGDFTDDQWENIGLVYDGGSVSNDPLIFVNGDSKAITELTTPVGTRESDAVSNLELGNAEINNTSVYEGDLGFIVYWSTGVTANEFLTLNSGVNPFLIKNENIALYSPIWGNDDPEPDYSGNGNTGANDATTKSTTAPNVELLENFI